MAPLQLASARKGGLSQSPILQESGSLEKSP